jgi:hypothetical protein
MTLARNQHEAGGNQSLFFNPKDGGDMFFEMSVDHQWTTWRYIPEVRNLHNRH